MNYSTKQYSQRGAATLITAVILLIAITLVTLLTAKTVLVETKQTADNYRTMQAVSAANYAMDYGVNYFDNGGFDQNADNIVDTLVVPNLVSTYLGGHTVTANLTFNNLAATRCVAAGATPDMSHGVITAVGFSDDGTATRAISQCVGPLELLQDDGPDMPLISRSQVALTGNANITNRYSNTNIWSGESVVIGSSSSMNTYIRDPSVANLDPDVPAELARLLETDPTIDTQLVSNRNLGNGLDIIDNDPSLGNLSAVDFFQNFFGTTDRDIIKDLAKSAGQYYTDIDDAIGKSGLIWVEGDQSLSSNGMIGSTTAPAILIVNGDFRATGGPTIYGLLYVEGEFEVAGTVNLVGSSIVEGNGVTAGDPVVSGNGTLNLVFWKDFLDSSNGPLPGLTTIVNGSWRDW